MPFCVMHQVVATRIMCLEAFPHPRRRDGFRPSRQLAEGNAKALRMNNPEGY